MAAGSLPVASWRAASSNPVVATVRVKDGELVVATNAEGQSVTVRFQVEVDSYWPGTRRWRRAL